MTFQLSSIPWLETADAENPIYVHTLDWSIETNYLFSCIGYIRNRLYHSIAITVDNSLNFNPVTIQSGGFLRTIPSGSVDTVDLPKGTYNVKITAASSTNQTVLTFWAIVPKNISTISNSGINDLFQKEYISPDINIVLGGSVVLSHNLGQRPRVITLSLKCLTAEFGFNVGDILYHTNSDQYDGVNSRGCSIIANASIIDFRMGVSMFMVINHTTGFITTLTLANWSMIFSAWA